MKKVICFLALMIASFGNAEERPYFIYGNVHALGAYPMVGVGMRAYKGIHGFDLSVNTCPLVPPSSLGIFHVRSLYLHHPEQSGYYKGAGLGLLNEPKGIGFSGSFEGVFGYQWENKVFLEGNVIVPFKKSQFIVPFVPGLTLGYGF